MSTAKLKIYLAGPFFNDAQRSLIRNLEKTLETIGYEVWSPSRDGIALRPDASNEDQKKVFDMNYHAINTCDMMVAVLEPNDTRGMDAAIATFNDVVRSSHMRLEFALQLKDKRLPQYSDIGTVWEMGIAYEQGKPTVAYYDSAASRPNLMLAKSCHGMAIGVGQLGSMLVKAAKGESSEYQGEIT